MKVREVWKSRLIFICSLPLYILFAKISLKIYKNYFHYDKSVLINDNYTFFSLFIGAIWLILLYLIGLFLKVKEIDKSIEKIKESTFKNN